jgi:hypothetical protein
MNPTRNIIKETIHEFVEEKENSIEFLIEELVDQLKFHKKFLTAHIQLREDFVNKLTYLEKYQKKLVEGLYGNNSMILEIYSQNFRKRVINESVFNFESEIDRFNEFIVSSTLYKSGLLSEQLNPIDFAQNVYNTGKQYAQKAYTAGKQVAQAVGNQATAVYNKAKESLTNAVNYIKKYGISQIMEGLRSALMSGVGTAIQVALSFTGAGAIVNDIAWGIMTLYDGYQYFVNGGSIFNLIIDVICLVTAGTLGKYLGKWVGQVAGSVSEAFTKFLNSGAGSWLKPIVSKIAAAGSWIMGYLGKAAKFMADKMGITWVANIVGKVGSFFSEILKVVEQKVGTVVGKAGAQIAEKIAGTQFVAKYGGSMSKKLASLGAAEVEAYAAKGIRNGTLDIIDKKLKELKDSTYESILSFIDKNYGTQYADLYAEVNNLKKLATVKGKIAGKVDDVVSGENIVGGTYIAQDKTGKVQKYVNKAKAAHERLAA